MNINICHSLRYRKHTLRYHLDYAIDYLDVQKDMYIWLQATYIEVFKARRAARVDGYTSSNLHQNKQQNLNSKSRKFLILFTAMKDGNEIKRYYVSCGPLPHKLLYIYLRQFNPNAVKCITTQSIVISDQRPCKTE